MMICYGTPRTLLPAEIARVSVHGSVDGVDRLWQCGYGSWVAPVTVSHIQNEIGRKQQKERLARRECDRLWLMIVQDIVLPRHMPVSAAMQGVLDHTGTHLTGCFGLILTRRRRLILVSRSSNNRHEKDLRPACGARRFRPHSLTC